MSARRGKWRPPPGPSPMILHLPRRSSLSRASKPMPAGRPPPARSPPEPCRNLRDLLDQERPLVGNPERRRGRWAAEAAETASSGQSVGDSGEERWRLQAEILRAECRSLRMERDVALRELERMRSGRKKIDVSEEGVEVAEIRELEELQLRMWCVKDGRRCGSNFDRQAPVLRRRLENIEAAVAVEEEETCGLFLSAAVTSAASTTTGTKRSGMIGESAHLRHGHSRHRHRYGHDRQVVGGEEGRGSDATRMVVGSCCNCKEVVGRIAEQVRVEAEQWNEMLGILDRVRAEIEGLHSSRDLWQRRAIASGLCLRSLRAQMLEWRRRALASEHKASEQEGLIFHLRTLKAGHFSPLASSSRTHSDTRGPQLLRINGQQQRSLSSRREKEKQSNDAERLPLQDIGNSCLLFKP